ncbi:MAG: hypothetical protein JSW34_05515 [Candidatus Zixiibacteriota bacterium]|nr:MAG: hypothetical protein JSW34_05515 [candidate division Zixibacteria bacterium]
MFSVQRTSALLATLIVLTSTVFAQDMPHQELELDCDVCHSLKEWSGVRFDHAEHTGFTLVERHARIECKQCHTLKDFSIIDCDCTYCHKDNHGGKLGLDCSKCHSPVGWRALGTEDVHLGVDSLPLEQCVLSDCVSCHKDIHEAKLGPDCAKCHKPVGWEIFDIEDIHAQTNFPLMGRHALADCRSCHQGLPIGDLSFETTRCVGCHQQQFLETTSPGHVAGGFPDECDECHQMSSWQPAFFTNHDAFFPIFSAAHGGEWDVCADCHIEPGNFQIVSCLGCHEHRQSAMDSEHAGIGGYNYNSQDCLICHPAGVAGGFVDHDALYFPIYSGPHNGQWDGCSECHNDPADRTQFNCLACHEHNQSDMDNTHQSINGYTYLSTACFACHPAGERIQFAEHDALYFPIYTGNHTALWSECSDCHTDPADRSVFSCLICHGQAETDATHGGMSSYQYLSSACFSCHPTGDAGVFTEHDVLFFPIYSGTHQSLWTDCADCHTDPASKSVFSCLTCHTQAETNPIHGGITSYVYESSACYGCHPDGTGGDYLEHDVLFFPIYSGTHQGTWDGCATCHTDPADRTVYDCLNCHPQATVDVVHTGMPEYSYTSTVCFGCHPSGAPEDYVEHDANGFFPIYSSAHAGVWAECATCHTDPADRTVFTCLICHDQTDMDNMHVGISGYLYISTDCYTCHPAGEEIEFTEHEVSYFPIYSGAHDAVWAECATCHTVPGDRTIYDCLSCHEQSTADVVHMGMPEYSYVSTVCYGCHPQGAPEDYLEHDLNGFFPIYSGNHVGAWTECSTCHTDPDDRSVFDCLVCHDQPTIDPFHLGMPEYSYVSSVCYTCHPAGTVEDYLEHDVNFFPIYSGTHDGRWSDCATCHIDPASKAVFSCLVSCHPQTQTDNKHNNPTPVPGYVYDSYECYNCHPTGVYP